MGLANNPEETNRRPLTPPDLIFEQENDDFSDDDSEDSDDEIQAPDGYALLPSDPNNGENSSDSENEENDENESSLRSKDPSEKVDVDAVKNAMSKIKLPTLALPDWGNKMTDEDFVAAVRETIAAKDETIRNNKKKHHGRNTS